MGFNGETVNLSRLTNPGPDDELRRMLQTPGDAFEDYTAPLFIAWQINSACNLGCLHCCEEAGHSLPGELTRAEALDFCRQIAALNIPYMAISGGEPLLCPHLFDVCQLIREHHISLKIETNGEFIDADTARTFAALKMRSVQISLDGATAQAHEQLRMHGDWEKAVTACKQLIKSGVNTEIVFVPTQFNIHEIDAIIELAYALGVYGFYTGKTMRIGRAAKNWDIICPSADAYAAFFDVLQEKTEKYKGKMKIYYYPYDVIEELKYRIEKPSASLLVIPNGKVKLIGPLPFLCGDLKKKRLTEIWRDYQAAWRKPQVVEFARKVIADPDLLAQSNHWIEV